MHFLRNQAFFLSLLGKQVLLGVDKQQATEDKVEESHELF